MDLTPLQAYERYASLGPDFLTWLLIRVVDTNVPAPASEPDLVIDIQGPLVFTGEGGEARMVSMAGDEAATAPEVFSALRQGKRLTRAKVLFTVHEEVYKFTLDAEHFDLKGVKLPVPTMPDGPEFVELRAQSLMRLYQLLDDLYEAFLEIRLSPDLWKGELEQARRTGRKTEG